MSSSRLTPTSSRRSRPIGSSTAAGSRYSIALAYGAPSLEFSIHELFVGRQRPAADSPNAASPPQACGISSRGHTRRRQPALRRRGAEVDVVQHEAEVVADASRPPDHRARPDRRRIGDQPGHRPARGARLCARRCRLRLHGPIATGIRFPPPPTAFAPHPRCRPRLDAAGAAGHAGMYVIPPASPGRDDRSVHRSETGHSHDRPCGDNSRNRHYILIGGLLSAEEAVSPPVRDPEALGYRRRRLGDEEALSRACRWRLQEPTVLAVDRPPEAHPGHPGAAGADGPLHAAFRPARPSRRRFVAS